MSHWNVAQIFCDSNLSSGFVFNTLAFFNAYNDSIVLK